MENRISNQRCHTYIGATNIISSLGFTTQENYVEAERYVSGIHQTVDKAIFDHPFLAARVDRQRLCSEASRLGLLDFTPLEQMLILSILDVVEQSGVDVKAQDCLIIYSTTKGNIETLEANTVELDQRLFIWKMAERITNFLKTKNQPIMISNACISGVTASIVASRLIREKKYKHVIVAGSNLITAFVVSGFKAFKSLSSGPCLPYDAARDGLTMGEGCATMLITSDPTLSHGVVIEGGAITNDANHISGPSRTGDGLCYAMEQAMWETQLHSDEISFINAHGTATSFNDEMESKAINLAGLSAIPVNSLKSYFGHTLGAAGVLELAMCVEQLKHGKLLATKGFTTLGVPEPIIVSGEHRALHMKRCIKTASGFGGCNAAIVLALEPEAKTVVSYQPTKNNIAATCIVEQGKVVLNNTTVYEQESLFAEFIRGAFKALEAPNMKFFKMDNLSKLGYIAAEYLLRGRSYNPSEIGIVFANRSASLDTDIKHQNILNDQPVEGMSPAIFVYTLPNVVLGEICIRHKIQGENTFFISEQKPTEFLQAYAQQLLTRHGYKAVIYGWCELLAEEYCADLTLVENE